MIIRSTNSNLSNSAATHLFAFLTYLYAPLYCSFARKKPLLSTTTREVFSCFSGQNSPQYRKLPLKQGLERSRRPHQPLFFAFRRSNRHITFRVSLQSKEVGKTAPYGIRIAKRQQVSRKTDSCYLVCCKILFYTI